MPTTMQARADNGAAMLAALAAQEHAKDAEGAAILAAAKEAEAAAKRAEAANAAGDIYAELEANRELNATLRRLCRLLGATD